MLRGLAIALAAVLLFAAPSSAVAGAPTEQLRSQIERVLKALEDPDLRKEIRAKDRRAAVRRIAEDIFDFSETARRSLGLHWAQRSAAERNEFVRLFADLLERSYLSKVELFNGEKVTYVGEAVDVDQAMVRTRIITKQGSEVPIDYRMLKRGDRWLVYDVLIEGVSLVANYRSQFNKIIKTSSYQELVRKMKTKQEEFLDNEKLRKS